MNMHSAHSELVDKQNNKVTSESKESGEDSDRLAQEMINQYSLNTSEPRCLSPLMQRLLVLARCKHGQGKSGVDEAPHHLLSFFSEEQQQHSLSDPLSSLSHYSKEDDELRVVKGNPNPIRNPTRVSKANYELHTSIVSSVQPLIENKSYFPRILTFGGDHSIAIGSISAISRLTNLAVQRGVAHNFCKSELITFWIDAHADINTPATTDSGNLHGCPVSLLAGIGIDSWRELECFSWIEKILEESNIRTFISPKKLVYIGTRDEDEPEKEIIQREGILDFTMEVLEKKGRLMEDVIRAALKELDPKGEHPIHISFDIDSLDPLYAPSTGTPVKGGLTVKEGKQIVEELMKTGRVISMDLVEVNPHLGTPSDVERTLQAANEIITCFISN